MWPLILKPVTLHYSTLHPVGQGEHLGYCLNTAWLAGPRHDGRAVIVLCLVPVIAGVGADYRPALAAIEVASPLGITYIQG